MIYVYPDCSGIISFPPSSLACHFEAHMHFRSLEMFKYMVFSAPEGKKSLDILLARSVERTTLRHTNKEILGRFGKNKQTNKSNYGIFKTHFFKLGNFHQRLNKYITSVNFHNLSTLVRHIF